jgi:hypothetical protein
MGLMALDTLRDISMRCRMTIDALQTLVLGLAGIEGFENTIVTGAALDGGYLIAVNHRSRAVRRVAECALIGRHRRHMRLMTLGALRDLAVLIFMTSGARDLAVFGRAVDQNLVNLIMTGAAVCGGDVRGIGNGHGLVRLMTLFAVSLDHRCAMRIMAVGAVGDVAVLVFVAGGARERGVFAHKIL